MVITLVILALAAFFFIQGKIRSDMVALCALVLLILFGILTPAEALSGFSNSIVIMMIGLFVVGGGIFQTGLAKMISNKLLKLAGNNQTKLFLLVMLVTALIGAFVSNTGTVALMLPVVVSMAVGADINPRRLLMPLAFASSMGGMLTLIGTPPNLVINDKLIEEGYKGLSFFSFTPIGLICIAVGILVLLPLTKWFLSKDDGKSNKKKKANKTMKELANEYQIGQNLYRARAIEGSSVVDKKLMDLNIPNKYNLSVMEIRRVNTQNRFMKTINQELAGPNTVIQQDDILYLFGTFEKVQRFVKREGLELLDSHVAEESGSLFSPKLKAVDIGIAEVLLMPNSKLINLCVKDSGFREKYSVNILGINRRGQYLLHELKYEKMRNGDALLVQGAWADIARLTEEQDEWVVVGQPLAEAAKVSQSNKAPIAAIIMLFMVVCMAFELMPAVAAVIIAALLMVFTGCLRNAEEAYKTINWESIVLIGAMLPMSLALENTGTADLVSKGLVQSLGGYGPLALLAGIYLTTSVLTMFISNTATAVLVAPIALSAAVKMDVSPYPFMFAVAVAASMCFSSPFSTPPNALVMAPGHYTFKDYIKVGLPLQVVMGIVMILVLPLLFPF